MPRPCQRAGHNVSDFGNDGGIAILDDLVKRVLEGLLWLAIAPFAVREVREFLRSASLGDRLLREGGDRHRGDGVIGVDRGVDAAFGSLDEGAADQPVHAVVTAEVAAGLLIFCVQGMIVLLEHLLHRLQYQLKHQ